MLSQEWFQGDLPMSAYSHCLSFHALYHGNNFETRAVSTARNTSTYGKVLALWKCAAESPYAAFGKWFLEKLQ